MITVSFSFVYGFLIDGITDICTISIYFGLASFSNVALPGCGLYYEFMCIKL